MGDTRAFQGYYWVYILFTLTCWLQNLKISLPRWDSPIWNTFFNVTFANRLEFLNGSKILHNTFFLVSLPLEKELSPSGLECHPWPSSYHLAASLWGSRRRQRGEWGPGFLTNQADDLRLQNSVSFISSWQLKAEISLGPSYVSWISQLYFEPYFICRCLYLCSGSW